jgi:hypothetical protein
MRQAGDRRTGRRSSPFVKPVSSEVEHAILSLDHGGGIVSSAANGHAQQKGQIIKATYMVTGLH